MTSQQLAELIAGGENSGVEFKRDDIRPEQLARECASFANLKGGRVLLGVEDDGTVSGLSRPDREEWVMDTVFGRYVHPLLIPFYQEVDAGNGKRVGVITVGEGTSKPYTVRHNDREDVYVRLGSRTKLATREQQARLFQNGGMLHVETLPVSGTQQSDLDKRRIEAYFARIVGDDVSPDSPERLRTMLLNMDLLKETENTGIHCTIAGLLLFGKKPRTKFHGAGIRLLVFPGADKDYNASRDEIIAPPVVECRAYDGDSGESSILEPDIFTQTITMLQTYVSQEKLIGVKRERVWDYPPEALREALVNAVAHRDYTISTDIEVAVYGDRLEIISPGAPPNGQTREKMLAGQRLARNPIIVEILRDYKLMDARGMGIRKKIVPLMRERNHTEPVFDITDDYVKVVLPKARG